MAHYRRMQNDPCIRTAEEWARRLTHAASRRDALYAVRHLRWLVDRWEDWHIVSARAGGMTWFEMSLALGIEQQSVHDRWRRSIERLALLYGCAGKDCTDLTCDLCLEVGPPPDGFCALWICPKHASSRPRGGARSDTRGLWVRRKSGEEPLRAWRQGRRWPDFPPIPPRRSDTDTCGAQDSAQ